jgi:hypothetical protein
MPRKLIKYTTTQKCKEVCCKNKPQWSDPKGYYKENFKKLPKTPQEVPKEQLHIYDCPPFAGWALTTSNPTTTK